MIAWDETKFVEVCRQRICGIIESTIGKKSWIMTKEDKWTIIKLKV